ncbi:MAG: nucleotidyl transferase AbiEii/AbiGii toxin family protein [Bacteroidia bacterium]
MENRTINISVVAEVAQALKELKDQMVFIGGAVVSLYADDPAADEIRPTGDIDMTINLMNFSNWVRMQERLAQLGFYPDPYGHAICSYKYKNIPVDIMPAEDGPLGPSNKWYKLGFENLWTVKAGDEEIQILSAPAYLATKFEAFKSRGNDYRTSHDFEDIIYILDNRITIVSEIELAHSLIKDFLHQEIDKILQNPYLEEILSAHIHPFMFDERFSIVLEKMNQILECTNS